MEKEISIFDYLPKFLPILDVVFITYIAFISPDPWMTTFLNIAMPALGFPALMIFRNRGRVGFYLIGFFTSLPLFFLNFWGSAECPTWLNEFTFVAGGLLLTTNFIERLTVLGFVLATSIIPMYMNHNSIQFLCTIAVAECAVWFLVERSVKFMSMQKAQIEKQKHIVEDKQKEILDSIHYAKRIQNALLTPEIYIERELNKKDH